MRNFASYSIIAFIVFFLILCFLSIYFLIFSNATTTIVKKKLPFELHPYFYAAIFNYDITKNAILELENPVPDMTNIANLINAHQEILDKKLNNTPQEMIYMMRAAKNAGAKATKIVGSGGGGCFFAMTDSQHKEKVISAILGSGAVDAFSVNLI